MNRYLITAALIFATALGASACDPPPGCQGVLRPTSMVGYDYNGTTNTWHRPDGSILGYAVEEDSTIWNLPHCIII